MEEQRRRVRPTPLINSELIRAYKSSSVTSFPWARVQMAYSTSATTPSSPSLIGFPATIYSASIAWTAADKSAKCRAKSLSRLVHSLNVYYHHLYESCKPSTPRSTEG